MCYSFPWLWLWASFLLCETWQFITAAVKEGNKEWQKKLFLFPRKWGERGFIW